MLKASGWKVVPFAPGKSLAAQDRCAIEEYPTSAGPADYVLCIDGQIIGIVEAKKLSLGPQNVLSQAERYSRGLQQNGLRFGEYGVPFLYSTNGEALWHHDVRYDAENRIKATASVTYTYDGDGNRVEKSNGKLYWYGSGSEVLDESDATGNITNEYIFFAGQRLARRVVSSGQVQYYFADHLGSSCVVTDASGNILDDADFYPFGGERTYSSSSGNAYKFTGKERDTGSGLDDFGARYYTYQLGRFMTPDWSDSPVLVPYAELGNPQTFNLYSYVANNPINTVDPDGHFRLDPGTQNYNDPDTGAPMFGRACFGRIGL